jgi:hypothetical protein
MVHILLWEVLKLSTTFFMAYRDSISLFHLLHFEVNSQIWSFYAGSPANSSGTEVMR